MSMRYAFGFIVLGIVLGFAVFKYSSNSSEQAVGPVPNTQKSLPTQSAAVQEIAQEFMCPCGSCSDPLDTCQCDHKNGALEVKSFIAQKLREGHKKPHIVEILLENYSGLKIKKDTSFKFEAPSLH